MDHRFPPLRPQDPMPRRMRSEGRALPTPAAVDITFLAALLLILSLALA